MVILLVILGLDRIEAPLALELAVWLAVPLLAAAGAWFVPQGLAAPPRAEVTAEADRRLAAADAAGIGTWSLDLDAGQWRWGPDCAPLFGIPADAMPTSGTCEAVLRAADQNALAAALTTLRIADQPVSAEFDVVWPDGAQHRLRLRGRGGPGASVGRGILVKADQPGTREEEIRTQLEAQLAQSQKMEAIGQLTGGIAHDFNNLLLAVNLSLEALNDMAPPASESTELIQAAQTATDQARTLIAQLLAFGRRQALKPTAFDVNASIMAQHALLRRMLEVNIVIETVLADDLWPAFADRHQFETAILNLAINARDAMPDGGRLLLETRNVVLDLAYTVFAPDATPGDYVQITVSDTGTGMTLDVATRAFEPFFTTKEVGRGSGLGLSQIYGYAKQSGGHARIYSEVGRGTSVSLYLPRGEAAEPRSAGPDGTAAPASASETILLVEDTPAVRGAVKRMLLHLGYNVLDVETAAEAIAVLESPQPIDLLFTDVILPGGMLGDELAVRARQLRPDLKVLLTSGYTQGRLGERYDRARMPLLLKPYSRHELSNRLRGLLTPPGDVPDDQS